MNTTKSLPKAWEEIDTKLKRGDLPATLNDSKSIYDLLENNGGLNIDPNLLYLNDRGVKTKGKVYFDRNKKGLFECIETTPEDYVTNSTTYFVDISNKASADRLNNLEDYESYELNKYINITDGFIIRVGKIVILIVDSGTYLNGLLTGQEKILIPEALKHLRPNHRIYFSSSNYSSNNSVALKLLPNGFLQINTSVNLTDALFFEAVYYLK